MGVRAPQIAVGVAVTETPRMDHVERGSRDHPHLAEPPHRLRESPTGDGHAHAALDDHRQAHLRGSTVGGMPAPYRVGGAGPPRIVGRRAARRYDAFGLYATGAL
ncbi:MAG: hypothetical protein M5T61_06625 [Acidimicrobiia bacterium]|nr:hypothetical protein [Acidimicrobiia bacterium]